MERGRRRFLTVAVAALTALGGCAVMRLGLDAPEVRVAGIQPVDATLLEQRFLITLRVLNPNNVEIDVEGLTFAVELNGHAFARGVSNQATVIPRLGEATLEVTATTGLMDVLNQLRQFQKAPEAVPYRLKGRLVTGRFGSIDFDRSGEVSLTRLQSR